MWICMYVHIFSMLIIKSAELCPLAARNNSLMPKFKPNYSLRVPVFFNDTPLHRLQLNSLSYLSFPVFSLSFFFFFFSWSDCCPSVHADQKRPQSSVTVCHQERGKDGWMNGWIDRWKKDGVSWRDGGRWTDSPPRPLPSAPEWPSSMFVRLHL